MNPRCILITAHYNPPFSSLHGHYTRRCAPWPTGYSRGLCAHPPLSPLSISSFFPAANVLHLALGLECLRWLCFLHLSVVLALPFSLIHLSAPTHAHLKSHMLMDILRSLPVGLIFIAAQRARHCSVHGNFKVVLFFH